MFGGDVTRVSEMKAVSWSDEGGASASSLDRQQQLRRPSQLQPLILTGSTSLSVAWTLLFELPLSPASRSLRQQLTAGLSDSTVTVQLLHSLFNYVSFFWGPSQLPEDKQPSTLTPAVAN